MEQGPLAVVSMSGGKDSTALLLLALEQFPKNRVIPMFADTGNEHEMTHEYIKYLSETLDLKVETVKADFSEWWWKRRQYVAEEWHKPSPKKGWPDGVPADIIQRVLKVFDRGPTGNPFLDLCIIKGRFPSRKAQFCTDFLKKQPLNVRINELVLEHGEVESWQGVRALESPSRAKLPERERGEEMFTIVRPILHWTVEQVFDMHRKHNVKPNPLYKMGMRRVGCMPCINVSKDELLEIGKRFPEHVDRIEEWETAVSLAAKRGQSTFIPSPKNRGDGTISGRQDGRWS